MPESYYDRMRNSTLASLSARRYAEGGLTGNDDDTDDDTSYDASYNTRSPGPIHSGNLHMITLDPATIQHELERGPAIHVDPDAAKHFPAYTPIGPPALSPNAAPAQPGGVGKNLSLGFQQGAVDLAKTFLGPGEATSSARFAGGEKPSDAILSGLGINQQQLQDEQAAQNIPSGLGGLFTPRGAAQFVGGLPFQAVRYGLGTVAGSAATGNPITGEMAGAAMMDAMKGAGEGATGEDALREGLTSGAVAGAMGGIGHLAGPQIGRAIDALPGKEDLQAAGEAANARLRSSGVYSGANASMGFDPATLRDLSISTGAQLGGGLYTVGEQAAARARQVRDWITNERNEQLTPQEQDQFAAARQSSPELHEVGDLMLPLEARQIIKSPQNVEAVTRMLRVIPDSAKLASAAKMGVSKLGWYRGSSQALMDVFGDDAPRFAQLLAAMSPQTSVESNLQNALSMWKNWTAAGRPTDPGMIKQIMGKSVQGGGTDKSVLGAWFNNSVAALKAANPQEVTLSGPKVDSFYHNLRDDVFRVTNDAWMANALGIAQDAFQGQGANPAAGNPGMTPMYAGASARLRDASLKAGMLPSQGQETVWSTAMQLYELARKNGIHPREVLERGMLTPEVIRGAPDFSTLMKEPQYARHLEEAGYGQQLQNMQPFQFPETSAPMSAAEQEQFGHMANILGETARMRGDVATSTKFAMPKPEAPQGYGSLQVEAQPGGKTRHFPETADLPYGSKGTYASGAFSGLQNLRDQPSLLAASGIPAQPTTNVVGAYKPRGAPAEVNPARSQGFTAPLVQTPEGLQADPQFMANVSGPAAVQNVMLAQEGTGIPVMVPDANGKNLSIRLPNKPPLQPEEMQALQQTYPRFAFAHTGPRLHVLNIHDLPLTKKMAEKMTAMARGTGAEPAKNLGDYLDFASDWAKKPGSGAVTQQMMDKVNAMTPEARNGLDQEVRSSAGKVLDFYQQKMRTQGWTPRQDLLTLLGTMRDQGLPGVQQGLKTGAFFPALAGAFLAPHLLQYGQQNGPRD